MVPPKGKIYKLNKPQPGAKAPDLCFSHAGFGALCPAFKTVWLTRPDLQEMFSGDFASFELWLALIGFQEYKQAGCCLPDYSNDLRTPHQLSGDSEGLVLSVFMARVWQMRRDLRSAFDLTDRTQCNAFIMWYYIHGRRELSLEPYITAEERDFLARSWKDPLSGCATSLTNEMFFYWSMNSDAKSTYDLADSKSRSFYASWYEINIGSNRWPARFVASDNRSELEGRECDEGAPSIWSKKKKPAAGRGASARRCASREGVNLVGHARGQFGIGEDIRMTAQCLRRADIPFCIIDVDPGSEISKSDQVTDRYVVDAPKYDTTIFCTTGFETARMHAVYGDQFFNQRRRIGFWPWELPDWPREWFHATSYVDEIWSSSWYTYQSYSALSHVKRFHAPLAVDVSASSRRPRESYGMAGGDFIFLTSFDVSSTLARKNPLACIEAFRLAFHPSVTEVRLVVKLMRPRIGDALYDSFVEACKCDPRIRIISDTFPRPELLDLYRACDCFVSLHRSEGFGRNIVEAMMLKKPVLVTAFSGNMDYCNAHNSLLVGYSLETVEPEQYAFGAGQKWAAPDVECAASLMRRVFSEAALRERAAAKGFASVRHYSVSSVSHVYKSLL